MKLAQDNLPEQVETKAISHILSYVEFATPCVLFSWFGRFFVMGTFG